MTVADRAGEVPTSAAWRARGTVRAVLGHDLFVIDEGPRDAPVLALLHGFPSASYDFWRVLPALARERRVIVHDHVGFGFSSKPRAYGYSISIRPRTRWPSGNSSASSRSTSSRTTTA